MHILLFFHHNDAFKEPACKSINNAVFKINKLVSKCRPSTILTRELKEMKKSFLKNVTVRWNSIYIMIKSYNKLSQ